jgi:mutator protein MutT
MDTLPQNRFKYCPVCASPDFVFDGAKSFRCSRCGFHFFVNSAAAVAAIICDDEGRILLTRRAFDPYRGMLDLPGGFVDPGECVEDALKREILEELGVEVVEMEFLFSAPNRYVFSNYTVFTADLAFRCVVKDIGNIITRDDVSEAIFVNPNLIDYDRIGSESIKTILKRYVKVVDN